ncbi:MAG: glutamine-hydrolyzing GMP synthase, partial [Thermodesulforhabdaceae bacterium]
MKLEQMPKDRILILDFGSQYTQLIARRIRESHVYCEIHPFNMDYSKIVEFAPKGIVFSGGPASVYAEGAPKVSPEVYRLGVPILGICYGLQLMCVQLGGEVEPAEEREYGHAVLTVREPGDLFYGIDSSELKVWMSHGDRVKKLPDGFRVLAHSDNSPAAAVADFQRRFYGVQFHPEVAHTPCGVTIIENFLFRICRCSPTWTMQSFIEEVVKSVRDEVGDQHVICALSGGVDSSVVAVLLHKAIGNQLHCVFVNNGLLRAGEPESVRRVFETYFDIPLIYVDASKEFLSHLRGVTDPEKKRKIIGNLFVEIFEREARKLPQVSYLAQGTLYPDVIESVSFKGPSATIKTHHNVGGLPERMNLRLIEPLR